MNIFGAKLYIFLIASKNFMIFLFGVINNVKNKYKIYSFFGDAVHHTFSHHPPWWWLFPKWGGHNLYLGACTKGKYLPFILKGLSLLLTQLQLAEVELLYLWHTTRCNLIFQKRVNISGAFVIHPCLCIAESINGVTVIQSI